MGKFKLLFELLHRSRKKSPPAGLEKQIGFFYNGPKVHNSPLSRKGAKVLKEVKFNVK